MKLLYTLALLAVMASASMAQTPQPMPPILRTPYPHLFAYFGLEPAQQARIVEVNTRFQRYLAEKARRAAQVQSEIQQELAQTTPAPMALGVRLAEIEAICREAVETRARTIVDVQGVLDTAQRQRFDALRQAFALLPIIREAQSANLLPREISGYRPPAPLREPEMGVFEWGIVQSVGPTGLPGCGNPARILIPVESPRADGNPDGNEP